jgi:hypothetical protein
MPEIDIKTKFEMSKDYKIIFRVCVKNKGENSISNVEVLLNNTNSIFDLIGEERICFDSISSGESCTSEFTFKNPENIDNDKIGAYVIYYNQKGKKCFASILPQKICFLRSWNEIT